MMEIKYLIYGLELEPKYSKTVCFIPTQGCLHIVFFFSFMNLAVLGLEILAWGECLVPQRNRMPRYLVK